MSEYDLTWMQNKAAVEDPEEVLRAHAILKRPANVPTGHDTTDDLKPVVKEEYLPVPSELDSQLSWFFPGLVYYMIGVDKSLFDLFVKATDRDVGVRSHLFDRQLLEIEGVRKLDNNWIHTLQGIDPGLYHSFTEFVISHQFRDPIRNLEWVVEAKELRIADPCTSTMERKGVSVTFFLPECVTSGRKVVVRQPPGLLLDALILGVERVDVG